jgi:GMP synthase-like glutamine amidotransferase
MKPVLIFRHSATEGPGHLAVYLDAHRISWSLVRIDEGEPVPVDASGAAGLVFMGGPMSVNDSLPWIEQVCDLIRDAVARDVPVLGHCLGGQLMAKALGGQVSLNPVSEIGWGDVTREPTSAASEWLGEGAPTFRAFHWHSETFSIPPGATRVMASAHCRNQGFAQGKHFAMQCHVEMTKDLIASWCKSGAREIERKKGPAVQSVAEIERETPGRMPALHSLAESIYQRWVSGLHR